MISTNHSLSLQERLFVPLLITGIFFLLSFGFMFGANGATRRMRVIGLCSTLFILSCSYCMAWHEQLTAITGWEDAWIAASGLAAIGSIYLGKTLLARHSKTRDEIDE